MKRLLLAGLILLSIESMAQDSKTAIHPKVKEYAELADTYEKTGKRNLEKMSVLANEINCLLTLEQAKDALPYFVNNKMRGRTCGSGEYPSKEILNKASVDKYKTSMNKMKK